MVDIYLKFNIRLTDYDYYYRGPLFYRWLPNNQNDAIILDNSFDLRVWFERLGFLGGTYIRYDVTRREIPDDMIPEQAVLDGGRLFGSAKFNATEEQIEAMEEEELGNAEYKILGKQIIQSILESVSKFIDLIRVDYGQYWIKPLKRWDSREESLGGFFKSLEFKWCLNPNNEWKWFQPTQDELRFTALIYNDDTFEKYITQDDWNNLREYVLDDKFASYEANLAKQTLGKAQQYWNSNDYKEAFITVVTALEIAIGMYIKKRDPTEKILKSVNANFLAKKPKLSTFDQVAAIFTLRKDFDMETIEQALDGISLRNEIIHHGREDITDQNNLEFKALYKCARSLISEPHYKYPIYTLSNSIRRHD